MVYTWNVGYELSVSCMYSGMQHNIVMWVSIICRALSAWLQCAGREPVAVCVYPRVLVCVSARRSVCAHTRDSETHLEG
jgi:hypothetical protein